MTPPEAVGGLATRRLLEDQIADERERRASLEARSVGVITTGGVIVSLTVGVGAAFIDPAKLEIPDLAITLTVIALLALVASAALAIAVVLPTEYEGVDPAGFVRLLEERFWNGPFLAVDRRAAEAQLLILISARKANRDKAISLSIALAAEALAVVLLGSSSLVVLLNR